MVSCFLSGSAHFSPIKSLIYYVNPAVLTNLNLEQILSHQATQAKEIKDSIFPLLQLAFHILYLQQIIHSDSSVAVFHHSQAIGVLAEINANTEHLRCCGVTSGP